MMLRRHLSTMVLPLHSCVYPSFRWSGASAGGMMPFEIALKGEVNTMLTHLSYGLLEERFSSSYYYSIEAAVREMTRVLGYK